MGQLNLLDGWGVDFPAMPPHLASVCEQVIAACDPSFVSVTTRNGTIFIIL